MPGFKAACPQCGAEVVFVSRASVFCVCSYCRSMLLRDGLDLRFLGEMAALQDDASILQLGALGRWKGQAFALRGRLRLQWDDGFWDEWYAPSSQADLWLAQAQGSFYISRASEAPKGLDPSRLKIDQELKLVGQLYSVSDIKRATIAFTEGELPFSGALGRELLSVDLVGEDDAFATLTQSDDGVELYTGASTELADLKMSGLRRIDGW